MDLSEFIKYEHQKAVQEELDLVNYNWESIVQKIKQHIKQNATLNKWYIGNYLLNLGFSKRQFQFLAEKLKKELSDNNFEVKYDLDTDCVVIKYLKP